MCRVPVFCREKSPRNRTPSTSTPSRDQHRASNRIRGRSLKTLGRSTSHDHARLRLACSHLLRRRRAAPASSGTASPARLTRFRVELGHLEGLLHLCVRCSPGRPATYWTWDLDEHMVDRLTNNDRCFPSTLDRTDRRNTSIHLIHSTTRNTYAHRHRHLRIIARRTPPE